MRRFVERRSTTSGPEEWMRSVVDHVVDGIVTIDERGTVQTFNKAAERMFGYRSDEIVGRNVRELMPEPDRRRHDGYIEHYLRTGQARIIGIGREVTGRRRDGTVFPMELAISEFRIGADRFFTGIVRDITERKRAENELRKLQDELQRRVRDLAEADRQKNEFLAMLSHELRNPLAPMRNALYIMKRAPEAAEGVQGMMERQLQHLVRLVDDLLDVSRIIRGKIDLRKERIDLTEAARRGIETARPVIDANVNVLHAVLPHRPVCVMGDLVRLSQVIANLLTNAAKYSKRGGHIELAVRLEGRHAVAAVRDAGAGIPAELLPRIFDLFVQGDHTLARSQGGLGIGLTVVKRLVEMHEGTASAFSAGEGQGSLFEIRLPALVENPAGPGPAGPAEGAGGPRRVLVVDDNRDAAETIAAILGLFGHQVQCAHDGPSALSTASRYRPDVVVLDIGLPGMDGYEVARRLRTMDDFRDTRIVAVTGYGQEADRQRSRDAGFDQHLTKPVDPDALQSFVAMAPAH